MSFKIIILYIRKKSWGEGGGEKERGKKGEDRDEEKNGEKKWSKTIEIKTMEWKEVKKGRSLREEESRKGKKGRSDWGKKNRRRRCVNNVTCFKLKFIYDHEFINRIVSKKKSILNLRE